jgi:hypothetical protein
LYPDAIPLLVGIIILPASLFALLLGLSVAIIELILGVLFGNLGVVHVQDYSSHCRSFGWHPLFIKPRCYTSISRLSAHRAFTRFNHCLFLLVAQFAVLAIVTEDRYENTSERYFIQKS